MEENKYVNAGYLLSHGFELYDEKSQFDICEMPFEERESFHFREKSFDRNMFVVILHPSIEHENHVDHSIYVQEDAGMGFRSIPERWCRLLIEHFESIYYGIRGEKPKFYVNDPMQPNSDLYNKLKDLNNKQD